MKRISTKISTFFILLILFISSCQKEETNNNTKTGDATQYSSDIAVEWMEIFRTIAKTEKLNPPRASRLYSYAGITLYESVVSGMSGYKSLDNQLKGFTEVPLSTNTDLDYSIVANDALYVIAKNLLPTLSIASNKLIEDKKAAFIESKRNTINSTVLNNSIERGRKIGNYILQWANQDNSNGLFTRAYTTPSRIGHPEFWQPTDAVNIHPLEPYWSEVRPFAMTNAQSCYVASAIPFSTTVGSAFYNQAMEVVTVKENLTTEQANIAVWWADVPGATSTPAGHWVSIENIIAKQKNLNLAQAAEMYALVGITLGDAFISCWESKYKVNLLRPKTYIQEFIAGQANWEPTWQTPPFPEYTSGHSVCSGAAATMLTHLFGTLTFTDDTNTSFGINQRTFTSFNEAAQEAAISRLYGGIHYREAIELGLQQGGLVAQAAINTIHLK